MSELLDKVVAARGGVEGRCPAAALPATLNFSGCCSDLKSYPGRLQPAVTIGAHSQAGVKCYR
jgi:hypothetical protein